MKINIKMGADTLSIEDIDTGSYCSTATDCNLAKRALEIADGLAKIMLARSTYPAPYDGEDALPTGFGSLG